MRLLVVTLSSRSWTHRKTKTSKRRAVCTRRMTTGNNMSRLLWHGSEYRKYWWSCVHAFVLHSGNSTLNKHVDGNASSCIIEIQQVWFNFAAPPRTPITRKIDYTRLVFRLYLPVVYTAGMKVFDFMNIRKIWLRNEYWMSSDVLIS